METTYMQHRLEGNATVFGKLLAIITALEVCPNRTATARDLVLAYYGQSGDGNANYRNQTEAAITALSLAGILSYNKARGRISDVHLVDTNCLAGIEDNEQVIDSRKGHRGELSYCRENFVEYVREHRESQKKFAASRKARFAA